VSTDHRIFWFRDDVFITSDMTDVVAQETGNYILQVIDTVSGCDSRDTSFVRISSSPITNIMLDSQDESCDGIQDAFITISQIAGGQGSIDVFVEGAAVQLGQQNFYDPGEYLIEVEDEFGCSLTNTVTLNRGEAIDIDAGPDQMVERGDKLTVVPQITGSSYTEIVWSGNVETS